ncbi:MAG: YfhO family protein [Planctomycetota bacterium]
MSAPRIKLRAHPLRIVEIFAALFFFAALGVAVFYPFILGGKILFPLHTDQINPWRGEVGPERLQELASHQNPVMTDKHFLFHPDNQVFIEAVRRGGLPLWNPYILGGVPYLGQALYGVFYPPHWLLAVIPSERAYGTMAALHVALAGFFTYLFLRKIGAGSPASLFGGVVFALSGPVLARMHYYMTVEAVAWLPLGLLLVEDWVRARRTISLVLVAPVVGLMVLTGFPQTAIYSVYAMGVWAVVRAHRKGPLAMLKVALAFAAVTVFGFLLSSLQIIPYLHTAQLSTRPLHTFSELARDSLSPYSLLTYVVPDLFGNPTWKYDFLNYLRGAYLPLFSADNFTETTLYAGVVTVVLALTCPLVGRGRARFLLPALAALFVVLAVLPFSPPTRPWLAHGLDRAVLVTGLGVGDPKRALLVAAFFVAAAAARALDGCLRSPGRWRLALPLTITLGVGVTLLVGLAHLKEMKAAGLAAHLHGRIEQIEGIGSDWPRMTSELALEHYQFLTTAVEQALILTALAFVALLVALVLQRRPWLAGIVLAGISAADLLHFGLPLNQGQDPGGFLRPTAITNFLTTEGRGARIARYVPPDGLPRAVRSPLASTVIVPNMGTHFHIEDAHGYIVQVLDRYGDLFDAFEPGIREPVRVLPFSRRETLSSVLPDIASIRYLLTTAAIEAPGYRLAFESHGYRVYENTDALERVACFARVLPFRPLDDLDPGARELEQARLLEALTAEGFDPHQTLLVEGGVGMPEPTAGDERALPRPRLTHHLTEQVRIELEPGRDAYLYLADSYCPGWEATVDGAPAEIVPANLAFRAVYLPAGARVVEMQYRPREWLFGLGLSIVALVLWAVALFLAARPRPPDMESVLAAP